MIICLQKSDKMLSQIDRLKVLKTIYDEEETSSERIEEKTGFSKQDVVSACKYLEGKYLIECNAKVMSGDILDIKITSDGIDTIGNNKQKKVTKIVRPVISRKIRSLVLSRDMNKCVKCGRGVKDGVKLEVDHKIPYEKGGTDDVENLQSLCQDCNKGKSNLILKDDK